MTSGFAVSRRDASEARRQAWSGSFASLAAALRGRREQEALVVATVRCRRCESQAGEVCRADSGVPRSSHQVRIEDYVGAVDVPECWP